MKNFKIKDAKGMYLGYDFQPRSGAMVPYFHVKDMSYSFTREEADRLVVQFPGATVVEEQ